MYILDIAVVCLSIFDRNQNNYELGLIHICIFYIEKIIQVQYI